MNKMLALEKSLELAKVALESSGIPEIPNEHCASELADFIETLASRLETMD